MSLPQPPARGVTAQVEATLRLHPRRTMWIGALLEVLAVGVIVAIVWHEASRESTLFGEATKYAWRLGWHDALHDRRFLPFVILAVLVYLVGAMFIAMRWVRSRVGLFVGVPLAALASAAILGVLVLIIVLLFSADGSFDGLDLGNGGSGRRGRRRPGGSSQMP